MCNCVSTCTCISFQVDGQTVEIPYSAPGMKVTLAGNSLRLETNFSLVLEFNGNSDLGIAEVPPSYANLTEGLCGDYDGNPDNDLTTSDGDDVSGDDSGHCIVGSNWAVPDPENPRWVV